MAVQILESTKVHLKNTCLHRGNRLNSRWQFTVRLQTFVAVNGYRAASQMTPRRTLVLLEIRIPRSLEVDLNMAMLVVIDTTPDSNIAVFSERRCGDKLKPILLQHSTKLCRLRSWRPYGGNCERHP
jgi:hypothetical protein